MLIGTREEYPVHRLVLEAWGEVPEHLRNIDIKKLEGNHIDGDKTNNDISNLEWVTRSENCWHRNHILGKCNENLEAMKIPGKRIASKKLGMEFKSSYDAAAYIRYTVKATTAKTSSIAANIRDCARGRFKSNNSYRI